MDKIQDHAVELFFLIILWLACGSSASASSYAVPPSSASVSFTSSADIGVIDASLYREWQTLPSDVLREMGYGYIGEPDSAEKALICYSILANRLETLDPKSEEGRKCLSSINNLGFLFAFRYHDYRKAQEYIIRALGIYEEYGFPEFMPMAYLNLASIYAYIDLYYLGGSLSDETMRLYRKALEESEKSGNDTYYLKVMNAIIDAAIQSGNPERLEVEFSDLSKKCPQSADTVMWKFTRNHLTAARMMRDDPKQSVGAYKRLLPSISDLPDSIQFKLSVMEGMALAQASAGEADAAISTLKSAALEADRAGMKEELVTIYSRLSQLYGDKGDIKNRDDYHIRYLLTKDSVFVNHRMRDAANRKIVEDLSERDRKITELSYQRKISGVRLTAVLVITLLISGFLIYFVVMNMRLKQRNRELYRKNLANLELEKSLSDLRNSQAPECSGTAVQNATAYANSNLTAEEKNRIVDMVERYLSQSRDIFSCDYKLTQLATALGIPNQHLSQALNEYGGKNFYTLLGEYRIREACRRMQDKEYIATRTVETIAQEVGIKSRSNFTAIFKNFTGLTPSQYIKAGGM